MSMIETVAVRHATPADFAAIEAMLIEMHAEQARIGSLSLPKVRACIEECLDRGTILLTLAPGTLAPVGCCGLVLAQYWFSEDWHLTDRFLFVHPQHRRRPHARALLRAAVEFRRKLAQPDEAGAPPRRLPLVMATFSEPGPGRVRGSAAHRVRGKASLYERVLGAPCGAVWTIED